jgi:aryl-alcohol dehydrogenase-like predicted oxidoreductase
LEKSVFPLCHRAGIGQVAFSPLAQGILSGKYKPGAPLPPGTRAADDRQNQFIKRFISDESLLKKVQRLVPLAAENGCTMSQLALAWALRRPEMTSCIIGASRPAQVEENAKASGLKLSQETIGKIEEYLS